MKRLRPLVIEPTRVSIPSETTSSQVRHEQVGRGLHVMVELVDGDAKVGLGVGRVLQFDHRDRQPVEEHRQVGTDDLARRSGDAELAHHQQFVRGRIIEVDKPRAATARLAGLRVAVLNLDAVREQAVEPAVVLDQRRVRGARQDAHDLLDGVVWQIGVEAMQRRTEAAFQHDLGGTAAFPRVVDLDAALDNRADRPEVDLGDVLDELFGR